MRAWSSLFPVPLHTLHSHPRSGCQMLGHAEVKGELDIFNLSADASFGDVMVRNGKV